MPMFYQKKKKKMGKNYKIRVENAQKGKKQMAKKK